MTISYTLDASQSTVGSLLKLLFRWRGSVWKAVVPQLLAWTVLYGIIAFVYRVVLPTEEKELFAAVVLYLDNNIDKYIPLSFLLGFFVTQVVGRWQGMIASIGWIDTSAINFATLIRGDDEETRILRRTLVRYMVLSQALILRDISLQVRNRFPSSSCLVTTEELEELQKVKDGYTRYWVPIQWCHAHLVKAKDDGKISSDYSLDYILKEVQSFRQGLLTMLRYDWVPLPLVYPQVVFLAVRVYFLICLISRQHIVKRTTEVGASAFDPWIPVKTVVEFFVYFGWMKVAEALLNPLGEDDDDIEANFVLDQNLIVSFPTTSNIFQAGFALVDQGGHAPPKPMPDKFYENHDFAPLYSLKAAKRTVHPLLGSAKIMNVVEDVNSVTMIPHKSKLGQMSDIQQRQNIRVVSVEEHNQRHEAASQHRRNADPDQLLARMRKHSRAVKNVEHIEWSPAANNVANNV